MMEGPSLILIKDHVGIMASIVIPQSHVLQGILWKTMNRLPVSENHITSGFRNTPQLQRSPISIHYSATYLPSREKKLLAAESYLKLVKYLTPDDESIQTSHIWNDNLNTENIFVNPDDPSKIYGPIDWQSTELAPLYDHTLQPCFLDYDGPPLDELLERLRFEDIRALFQN